MVRRRTSCCATRSSTNSPRQNMGINDQKRPTPSVGTELESSAGPTVRHGRPQGGTECFSEQLLVSVPASLSGGPGAPRGRIWLLEMSANPDLSPMRRRLQFVHLGQDLGTLASGRSR